MKEQVIREIDLDKRFKKKCWGNQVLPSPLTVLPAVCRRRHAGLRLKAGEKEAAAAEGQFIADVLNTHAGTR